MRLPRVVAVALALMFFITPTALNAQVRNVAGVITELKRGHGVVGIQIKSNANPLPARKKT